MDALKLLREEAARKRKAITDSGVGKGKKYFKRSELMAVEAQRVNDEAQLSSGSSTYQKHGGESSGVVLQSPTSVTPVEGAPIFSMPRAEVIRRLREREEPIRLFGETDRDVCLRLRQIEILAPEVNKGLRNDFMDAFDKVDQEYLDQLAKQEGEMGVESADLKVKDDGTTMEELVSLVGELEAGNDEKQQEICLKTFRFLLREWAKELNERPLAVKRSHQGKLASATFKQTESYLSPLFRQLRKKTTLPDIQVFLAHICANILRREYVQANDIYLQMAIGNAPWPIGVTMVGIHARTGREKIFAQQIAHVLNDETQRKYIQAVKRLMTFCQRKWETDPSKCVEYHGIKAGQR